MWHESAHAQSHYCIYDNEQNHFPWREYSLHPTWYLIPCAGPPPSSLLGLWHASPRCLPMMTSFSPGWDFSTVLGSTTTPPCPEQRGSTCLKHYLRCLGMNCAWREGKKKERPNFYNLNVSMIWIFWPQAPVCNNTSFLFIGRPGPIQMWQVW